MVKRFVLLTALVGVAALSLAQGGQSRGKAETTIGGKKVVIDYGRPALKGRKLGDLMSNLPPDRIWRAGENQVTTLETAGDIQIGDTKIPAGKYSLYIHAPASGDWSLCVNENLGVPLKSLWAEAPAVVADETWPMLAGYKTDSEVSRIKLDKVSGGGGDTFEIAIDGDKLMMSWGDMSFGTTIKAGM